MFYQSVMGWINYYIKQCTVSLIMHQPCLVSIHFQTLSWRHASCWLIRLWHSHLFTTILPTWAALLCTEQNSPTACANLDLSKNSTQTYFQSPNLWYEGLLWTWISSTWPLKIFFSPITCFVSLENKKLEKKSLMFQHTFFCPCTYSSCSLSWRSTITAKYRFA